MHHILCFSGGVDSVVAYFYIQKIHLKRLETLDTIYFNYNDDLCKAELEHVLRHWSIGTKFDNSINIPSFDCETAYMPNRNLLFATRAAAYYKDDEPVTVWMAGLKDDMVEDKTPTAFALMSQCLTKTGRKEITVRSPFWDKTKSDVLKWYKNFDPANAQETIRQCTFSCYTPDENGKECLHCPACYRKACALSNAGYSWEFGSVSLVEEYYNKALKERYVPERCLDIIRFSRHFHDKILFDYSSGYKHVKKDSIR